MIQLQPRDLKILRDCYEQQFLLMKHLTGFHFKGLHIGEAYRRVTELEQEGYLVRRAVGFGKVIRLGEKGKPIAESESPWELPKGARFHPNYAQHDALVTTVRLRLEELWDANWKPGAVIRGKRKRARTSDALGDGHVRFPSGSISAIEVETTSRKQSEWIELLRNWEQSEIDPLFVLLVFTDALSLERAKRAVQTIQSERTFFVTQLSELLNSPPGAAWFTQGQARLFENRSFP